MATTIGTENNLNALLNHLTQLEYNAIEAYDAAIDRLDNQAHKNTLQQFRLDHVNHTLNLSEHIRSTGENPPEGPSFRQILTTGKIVLADLVGDNAILKAMLSNEADMYEAYHQAVNNPIVTFNLQETLRHNYVDAKKHTHWFESITQPAKAA